MFTLNIALTIRPISIEYPVVDASREYFNTTKLSRLDIYLMEIFFE